MSYVVDLRVKRSPKFGRRLVLSLSLPELKRRLNWMLVVMMLMTIAAPIFDALWTGARYDLRSSQSLIPAASQQMANKLSFDQSKQLYQFNKDGRSQAAANQDAALGSGKLYSADLPADASKGITLYDNVNQLSLSFTPQFATMDGKPQQNRLVYPLQSRSPQMVFSLLGRGVKEDIVLRQAEADQLSFRYNLNLPTTLEARLLDDGAVGIYSADPALFGNISFGSDSDRTAVEKARTNGQKTYLAFVIPAPQIKQSGQAKTNPRAKFALAGDTLTVTASGLMGASYPLTIDPSFIVTSSSDFQKGNLEDGLDFDDSNGLLKRGAITGGTVGSWSSTTGQGDRKDYGSFVYNGKLYLVGGGHVTSGAPYAGTSDGIVSATIDPSTGTLGSFSSAGSSLPQQRTGLVAAVYNGYAFVMGGTNGTTPLNSVLSGKIGSDGQVISWTTLTSFTTGREFFAGGAYNGYLYLSGGCANNVYDVITGTCPTILSDIQYAKIAPDGTVSAWTQQLSSLPPTATGRMGHAMVFANGKVYDVGGCSVLVSSPCQSVQSQVYFAPINSNGSVGSFTLTSSLPTALFVGSAEISGGYLYYMAGHDGSNGRGVVYYAPINADGSLGSWNPTTSLPSGNREGSAFAYGGVMYFTGGASNISYSTAIDPAGTLGSYKDSGTTLGGRWGAGVAVQNSTVYVVGGCNTNCNGSSPSSAGFLNTVSYATINSDGTLSSWQNDSHTLSFTDCAPNTGVLGPGVTIYNGFLYVVGGECLQSLGGVKSIIHFQFAPINNGGSLSGGFTQSTTQLYTLGGSGSCASPNHRAVAFPMVAGSSRGLILIGGVDITCGSYTNAAQIAGWDTNGDGDVSSNGGCGCFVNLNGLNSGNNTRDTNLYPLQLPVSLAEASIAVNNNYLYIIGGLSTGNALSKKVYFANLNAGLVQDCTTPTDASKCPQWQTASHDLPTARQSTGAIARDGYLYVAGGWDGTSFLSDIQRASLDPSTGDVGSFSQIGSLNAARAGLTAMSNSGNLYFTNGCNSGSMINPLTQNYSCGGLRTDTEVFQVNNGGPGAIGWQTCTSSPNNCNSGLLARYAGGSVAVNGYIYAIGGCNSASRSTCTAHVASDQYAQINADGSLGSWQNVTSSKIQRFYYGLTNSASNGYIYAVGGCATIDSGTGNCATSLDGQTDTVLYAKPGANGDISSWTTSSLHLPATVSSNQAVSYGGYLYEIGTNGSVIYAKINSDGSLTGPCSGTWCSGGSLNQTRSNFAATVYAGHIYVAGGGICGTSNDGCLTSKVEQATISPDGSLGTWTLTTDLPYSAANPLLLGANGYLYFLGGWDYGNGYASATSSAPVLSNGGVGQWTFSKQDTAGVDSSGGAVWNGYMYIVAGRLSASENNVQFGGIQAIPRIGHYSREFDSDLNVAPTKLVANGSLAASGSTSLNYQTALSAAAIWQNSQSPTLTLGNPLTITTDTGGLDRYYWFSFTLDDSQAATFPDTNQTVLSDFTLYYHPAPSKRLRGGKTFTGNAQQSLDASP